LRQTPKAPDVPGCRCFLATDEALLDDDETQGLAAPTGHLNIRWWRIGIIAILLLQSLVLC